MKKFYLKLSVSLLLLLLVGCLSVGMAAEKFTIGLIQPQLDADGFRANYIGVSMVAAKNGVGIISLSAENSAEKQLSQIEDLITRGVKAIIFTPVDADALSEGVEKANAAKIPIIAMDRTTTSGTLTGLVESDNVAHGKAGADLIAQAAKKAHIALKKVVILELLGDQATSSGVERHQGFVTRAKELGLKIVTALPTHWNNDEAYSATLDAFQAHPEINAIFEASDIAMHAGVESALSSLNKLFIIGNAKHIIITAVDGGPNGLKSVKAKYIDGIAAQQLLEMGRSAAQIAIDAAEGKTITNSQIHLAPDLVTPENVDSPEHWANQIKL